ncbi:MAG: methionine ABC transporter permease [Clostridium sp.]|uniref:methionine ABC transporter permease n=1 Tax=Clostridium sp. TaxID=1506 RepID=UPI00290930D0|nr:methionine ABC transporter permease [Clostridium sp.]MDU7336541.1 methionine ABC transporter permease [Clostridium sp.]
MLDNATVQMLLVGVGESLYMTLFSAIFSYIIGLPLGILLVISAKDGIRPNAPVYKILDIIVNITRSIPFLILMVMIIPVTRAIVGTSLGSTAAIVPLTFSAAPFIARMVESSLMEVDKGVIEAAHSMGASNWQIIKKVLIPEAFPSLINGATIAFATILGYSAIAGFVGGGGLGAIAVNYGYYRYQTDIMLITVALLVVLVQIFQEIGMRFASRSDKRKF